MSEEEIAWPVLSIAAWPMAIQIMNETMKPTTNHSHAAQI
jgi:hypothetical protein